MNEIKIIDGIVRFPSEWIVINNLKPQDSRYVGVVEIRNGVKYNAPHFLFFSSVSIGGLSYEEENLIIYHCIDAYPPLANILTKHVPLRFDINGDIINGQEWLNSPLAGCFSILEHGATDNYIFGAMIIRIPARGSK